MPDLTLFEMVLVRHFRHWDFGGRGDDGETLLVRHLGYGETLRGGYMKKVICLLVASMMFCSAMVYAEKPKENVQKEKSIEKKEFKRQEQQKRSEKNFSKERKERRKGIGKTGIYLKFRKELNLTDEQIKKLENINVDYEKNSIRKDADMKILRMDLGESLRKDKPNYAVVREKIKKISDIQLESKLKMIEAMEESEKVLTKEQHDKLLQLKESKKERHQKMEIGEEK